MIITQSDAYTVRAEFVWFGVILHGDVHVHWTKGVRDKLRQDIRTIAASFSCPVYAFQTPKCDPKKRRFILSVGGVFDHTRFTPEGLPAQFFRFLPID